MLEAFGAPLAPIVKKKPALNGYGSLWYSLPLNQAHLSMPLQARLPPHYRGLSLGYIFALILAGWAPQRSRGAAPFPRHRNLVRMMTPVLGLA